VELDHRVGRDNRETVNELAALGLERILARVILLDRHGRVA
jgi:hypothetical protein